PAPLPGLFYLLKPLPLPCGYFLIFCGGGAGGDPQAIALRSVCDRLAIAPSHGVPPQPGRPTAFDQLAGLPTLRLKREVLAPPVRDRELRRDKRPSGAPLARSRADERAEPHRIRGQQPGVPPCVDQLEVDRTRPQGPASRLREPVPGVDGIPREPRTRGHRSRALRGCGISPVRS